MRIPKNSYQAESQEHETFIFSGSVRVSPLVRHGQWSGVPGSTVVVPVLCARGDLQQQQSMSSGFSSSYNLTTIIRRHQIPTLNGRNICL